MNYSLHANDYNGRSVNVGQQDLEYLGDVAELFLTFLHAAGYSYVRSITLVKDDGQEVSTQ
jgi:hypothetical protein